MKYPEGKIKRVFLEFEGGSLELRGKEAERWKQEADGMAVMNYAHGMAISPLKWKVKIIKEK